jgi:hypothetical protein
MPSPASAWNGTGHEVVAQVAWDQLSPSQRSALVDVLKAHPRFQKDLMQHLQNGEDAGEHAFREAATWPDYVKTPMHPLEKAEDHKTWHYVDFPYDLDGQDGPMPPTQWDGHSAPTDLVQALQMVTSQLKDPATPAPRKAIDLCWVLHLVGDAHQPLHDVSLFSKSYPVSKDPTVPSGDQGGNLVHVATPDNPNANLHSIWDGLEGRSYDPDVIHKTAARIEKDHPRSSLSAEAAVTDPAVWTHDGFELAKHDAYLDGKIVGAARDPSQSSRRNAPPLPVGYESAARKVADVQIALAGYRLADLLRSLPESQP